MGLAIAPHIYVNLLPTLLFVSAGVGLCALLCIYSGEREILKIWSKSMMFIAVVLGSACVFLLLVLFNLLSWTAFLGYLVCFGPALWSAIRAPTSPWTSATIGKET